MKNAVFWDATPLALVRTDVSEEIIAQSSERKESAIYGNVSRN
jgi:hypothetical protein